MILCVSGMYQVQLEGYRTGALNRLEAILLLLTIVQCTAGLLLENVRLSEYDLNWLRDGVSYSMFYGCIAVGLVYSAVVWSQNMKLVKETGAFNLKDVTAAHRTMGFRLRQLLPKAYVAMTLVNIVIYMLIATNWVVSGVASCLCVVILALMYRSNMRAMNKNTHRKVSMLVSFPVLCQSSRQLLFR